MTVRVHTRAPLCMTIDATESAFEAFSRVLLFHQSMHRKRTRGVEFKCFVRKVVRCGIYYRAKGLKPRMNRAVSLSMEAACMETRMKSAYEQSLRYQVEKWLAPGSIPVHVTQFSRTRSDGRRYVCVQTSQGASSRALFFFRHDDGRWCVYPPAPASNNIMRGERLAA